MKKLPTEVFSIVEDAKKKISLIKEGERIKFREPCNCGSQIRHNDGGNYHEIITIARDSGKWFVRLDTTCELTPIPDWDETSEVEVIQIVETSIRSWYG